MCLRQLRRDRNEGGGRPVNLILRTAPGPADDTGQCAGDDALFRPQPHRRCESHCHWDCGQRNDESGAEVAIGGFQLGFAG